MPGEGTNEKINSRIAVPFFRARHPDTFVFRGDLFMELWLAITSSPTRLLEAVVGVRESGEFGTFALTDQLWST